MTKNKISLIIPAYNEEKYLGECLREALKNGGELHEIIVVNNASTDNTKSVAQSFETVKVVDESRKGLTKARQRGFLETEGEILAYNDADTKMPKGWVEKVVKHFEKDETLVCVSGPGIYYDQSSIGKIIAWVYWFVAYIIHFFVGYMVYGANFAVKKSALEKIGGFDESISFYGEDTNLARRLSKVGKVKFVLNFYIYNSARRAKSEGLAKMAIKYIINFISEVWRGKPANSEYKDIR
jgi:glycosyltransferase involved in cell wall biosynthesis